MSPPTAGSVKLNKPASDHKFVAVKVEDVLPAARRAHKAYLDARNAMVAWGRATTSRGRSTSATGAPGS